jgi:hypothetical protein
MARRAVGSNQYKTRPGSDALVADGGPDLMQMAAMDVLSMSSEQIKQARQHAMSQPGCPPGVFVTAYTEDREHRVNDMMSEMTGESDCWVIESFSGDYTQYPDCPEELLNTMAEETLNWQGEYWEPTDDPELVAQGLSDLVKIAQHPNASGKTVRLAALQMSELRSGAPSELVQQCVDQLPLNREGAPSRDEIDGWFAS